MNNDNSRNVIYHKEYNVTLKFLIRKTIYFNEPYGQKVKKIIIVKIFGVIKKYIIIVDESNKIIYHIII